MANTQSRYFAPDNFALKLSGVAQVFGTSGLQDISVLNFAGSVVFDPSFNRGGDIIRLGGNAAQWQIARSGSSAVLSDGDTTVTIPIGDQGIALVFGDGARTLKFDGTLGAATIGNQALAEQAAKIVANPDNTVLPTGVDPSVFGRLFLVDGSQEVVDGNLNVFGTNGPNGLGVLGGNVILDPSFSRGGDQLAFKTNAENVTAVRSGSSVILDGPGFEATVPIGVAGMTVAFAGPDPRELIFDAATSTLHLGGQLIDTIPISIAAFG